MNENPSEDLVKQLSTAASGSIGWMKFLGVLLIIIGVILAISVVGLLVCWLPIWLGVILFKAADDAETASQVAPQKLLPFVEKINRFFLISGVLALILLVVILVMFFFLIMFVGWGLLGLV